jgi:hypothetical protein
MAKQRYINTRFWDDTYISSLDPIEKLLFIYFITNPLTEISGAYEIQLKRVALDTGIDRDMVQKILNRFADEDRVIFRDGWIFVTNFIKHQSDNEKINTGIQKLVSECPEWIQDRVSIEYGYRIDVQSHRDRDRDRDSIEIESEPKTTLPLQEKNKRGSRIDANFRVTEEMRSWATLKFPTYDIDAETEKFVNYWLGASGRNAVKMNWEATWRNWFINEKQPILKKSMGIAPTNIDLQGEAETYARRFAE